MKYILIILSILLLSSPVIGQKTGVLYLYETSSGWEWKTFGDGKVQPKYKGKITNGKPNGCGVLTYPDLTKYVGEYKNGLYHGQGTLTSEKGDFEGDRYVGEFKEGKKHGQGTYTWSDGRKYVGEWDKDKYNGKGTINLLNGYIYEGDFKNGIPHGNGILYSPDGIKGVGEFKQGKNWNTIVYDKDGNEKIRYVNGVEQIGKNVNESKTYGVLFLRLENGVLVYYKEDDENKGYWKYVGEIEMEYRMVKGQSLRLMEVSMLGNTGMGIGMVKENTLGLMEENMLGIG